ncbi:MAG: FG-GAP repeat protein [Phycisphaerales bacterium]|nr:MAG: FG-GAP repeat protein [Phycisphaerales bacterium]
MSETKASLLGVVGAVVLAIAASPGLAQCEVQKLTASDANGGAEDFGFSVSISGDLAVIGAQADDHASPGDPNCISGSAYIFRRVGVRWAEETKLTASDAACGDHFGYAVSISGYVVAVGALGKDQGALSDCGVVYIFRRDGTTWLQEQKLTAPNPAQGDNFGESVALNGNAALVGVPGDNCSSEGYCGSAYVYRFDGTGWVQEANLIATDGATGDSFGKSVSISGDTAIVGAVGDDCVDGSACGSAYVFTREETTWDQDAKLTASDRAQGDWFGKSVSVSGDQVVVGAYSDDCAGGPDCGSAYVFRRNGSTWVQEIKLVASDAAQGDLFGNSVSIDGDVAIVGAMFDDCVNGLNCGAAYIFQRNSNGTPSDRADDFWEEMDKLVASDPGENDYFGHSVAVAGDVIMAGADGDDDACPGNPACNSGSVFVYSLPVCLGIPTLSEWGLLTMMLLLLSAGIFLASRRRRTSTR